MAVELTGPGVNLLLFCKWTPCWTSKFTFLYSLMLSEAIREASLQWTVVKSRDCPTCREWESVTCSFMNATSIFHPLPRLRDCLGRGAKKTEGARGYGGPEQNILRTWQDDYMQELIVAVVTCTRAANIPAFSEEGFMNPASRKGAVDS